MSYREALNFFGLDELYIEKELTKKYNKFLKLKDINKSKLDIMYDILLNECRKRQLKEFENDILLNIDNLKNKYRETKIYDVCLEYEKKLKKINNIGELEVIKNKFDLAISELKKEIIIPDLKNKILTKLNKYENGYSNELKKIVNNYKELITKADTLGSINSVSQKYDLLLKEELVEEKKRLKELEFLKNGFIKSQLYYFNLYTRQMEIDDIKLANDLLVSTIELISIATLENKDAIFRLVGEINYNDLLLSINKFKCFYLESLKDKKIGNLNIKINKIRKNTVSKYNHELIDIILDKYYLYTTKKTTTIDKIIKDNDNFKEIMDILKKYKKDNTNYIIKYLKDINYKNIKVLLEAFDDFTDPNKVYIERDTGNLCVFKDTTKKIYTVFLDGRVVNDIITKGDIIWKYIPILKFFNVSTFTDGYEMEIIGNDSKILNDYNANYLYFTNELLLCLIDDSKNQEFKFIPAGVNNKFQKGENIHISRNSYLEYYKKKDKCLHDLFIYIKNKDEINKK